jgi:hypothetical protein
MTTRYGGTVAWRSIATAGLLLSASTALFWPGIADYDTVGQYQQVLSGTYRDWHPPVMARLWAGLHALVGGGAAPMLVLQLSLYWVGLALIAGALARAGRGRAAAAVLLVGCWPVFLGWQGHVLKDAQMTGATLAAVGLVAWWRLGARRVPGLIWTAVGMLLLYAVLVRANAVFALAPLAAGLMPARPGRRWLGALAMIVATIVASGPINHRLLGAEPTGVERTEPIYDLAGVAVRVDDLRGIGLDAERVTALRTHHCVKPFFWDPLGDGDRCEALVRPLHDLDSGRLYAVWLTTIVHHPLAYAAHRARHVNSTWRWLVPAGLPSAEPAGASEPNADGLVSPGARAARFERVAGWCAQTPLGWPIVAVATALALAVLGWRREAAPARDLALALLASALTLEASFAVLSIASDVRYHLWPMIATALAAILLLPVVPGERRWATRAGIVLALVIAAGVIARATLPVSPATYAGMMAA